MTKRRRARTAVYDAAALLRKPTLRIDEAAYLLSWSESTVDRAMRAGDLPYKVTPGGHRRPTTEGVKKYL